MNTFWSTKKPAEYLLILAVFLRVPSYRNMASTHGGHQPSLDPLPDLSTFVEGQGPINRRVVLEKTAFSAMRVLMDENFKRRFEEPQQREHKYLSRVLKFALDNIPTMLGCLEGTLDRYWRARIVGPTDHPEAFTVSLISLAAAKHLPQGPPKGLLHEDRSDSKAGSSCSPMTSSTTLNGSICDKTSGKEHAGQAEERAEPEKSFWESETRQKGFWEILTFVFSSCMGRA
jgi:hypothetical protein